MRKTRRVTILAVALAVAAIWVVLTMGATAVWLTGEVRVFGLAVLATAIAASLLVVCFDWRENLLRRMLDERKDYRKAA